MDRLVLEDILICATVGECKATLHNGEVKFQVDFIDNRGKKAEILLDDSDVTSLIIYGIEHLAEDKKRGAVRLKECLIDMAFEVFGKEKE